MLLVVDGANVVGSRPDGWWRDRAGAAERLATQLAAARRSGALAALGDRVVLVLEGEARGAAVPEDLEVLLAPRDGDSTMVELVHESPDEVTVVTADRELIRLVTALGARTVSPRTLLRIMEP
ncbi:hypothetical protein [Pseudonocardia oroxyli]|uniref:YacP-like NYN domain-containing protein n=1 Tax=Pseudonocardia oroxyli TaxID=366584 RepID=A0A1G7HYL5_PSEOR|nr:hypothetical protein [Pseudonocardia oroxyli]SDF05448.1 hypothetical protein SAMN05216377_103154 [Pseudonocardia oroxyli]